MRQQGTDGEGWQASCGMPAPGAQPPPFGQAKRARQRASGRGRACVAAAPQVQCPQQPCCPAAQAPQCSGSGCPGRVPAPMDPRTATQAELPRAALNPPSHFPSPSRARLAPWRRHGGRVGTKPAAGGRQRALQIPLRPCSPSPLARPHSSRAHASHQLPCAWPHPLGLAWTDEATEGSRTPPPANQRPLAPPGQPVPPRARPPCPRPSRASLCADRRPDVISRCPARCRIASCDGVLGALFLLLRCRLSALTLSAAPKTGNGPPVALVLACRCHSIPSRP